MVGLLVDGAHRAAWSLSLGGSLLLAFAVTLIIGVVSGTRVCASVCLDTDATVSLRAGWVPVLMSTALWTWLTASAVGVVILPIETATWVLHSFATAVVANLIWLPLLAFVMKDAILDLLSSTDASAPVEEVPPLVPDNAYALPSSTGDGAAVRPQPSTPSMAVSSAADEYAPPAAVADDSPFRKNPWERVDASSVESFAHLLEPSRTAR